MGGLATPAGAALLLAALAGPASGAMGQTRDQDRPFAVLRGLDKFSGLTTTFEAPVGAAVGYARLSITVRACRVRADDPDDATAYVEIVDLKPPAAVAFRGWMVASSPAVSALDHPRYDVWVLSCSTVSAGAS